MYGGWQTLSQNAMQHEVIQTVSYFNKNKIALVCRAELGNSSLNDLFDILNFFLPFSKLH